jgi:hypothetical protein
MIENRPAFLLADPAYRTLPKLPLKVDWASIPELLRVAMLDLSGIQPITKAMAEAAGGKMWDKPSEGEIELFRKHPAGNRHHGADGPPVRADARGDPG